MSIASRIETAELNIDLVGDVPSAVVQSQIRRVAGPRVKVISYEPGMGELDFEPVRRIR